VINVFVSNCLDSYEFFVIYYLIIVSIIYINIFFYIITIYHSKSQNWYVSFLLSVIYFFLLTAWHIDIDTHRHPVSLSFVSTRTPRRIIIFFYDSPAPTWVDVSLSLCLPTRLEWNWSRHRKIDIFLRFIAGHAPFFTHAASNIFYSFLIIFLFEMQSMQ